jgi:hypothetical protein
LCLAFPQRDGHEELPDGHFDVAAYLNRPLLSEAVESARGLDIRRTDELAASPRLGAFQRQKPDGKEW